MKILLWIFVTILTCFSVQAQEDYKKITSLSYQEIDSLMYIEYRKGSYDKAILLMQAGREKAQAEFGEMDSLFAGYTANLGFFYSQIGAYDKTESLYVQAIYTYKQVLGEKHPSYATSLNNLGLFYNDMGAYREAEAFLVRAMDIWKEVFGENHANYALSLNSLGVLYKNMGFYPKAESFMLQAVEKRKKLLGEKDPLFAESINNLGAIYNSMGVYDKAEILYVQAMNIRKQILGNQHPDYALSINNLALLYSFLGDYAKAEPLYFQAMNIFKAILGEQHPDYAVILNNLGGVYMEIGAYAKAVPLYIQSMDIWKKTYGSKHPKYALSLNNLGLLYDKIGDYKKAESFLIQAIEIQKETLGEQHYSYSISYNNLGLLYMKMNEDAKSEAAFFKAMSIQKEVLGEKHPDYALTQNNLGDLYKKMGTYDKAELLYAQAMKIQVELLGEKHLDYAITIGNLTHLYQKKANYTMAQSSFAKLLPLRLNYLHTQGNTLGEKAKQDLFQTIVPFMEGMYYFAAFHCQHDSLFSFVQEGSLCAKGYALAGVTELLPLIKSMKDSTLERIYTHWIYTKDQLGKGYQMGQKERIEKGVNIDSLERIAAQQESALMQTSAALKERLGYNKKQFQYKDLVASIRKNEVIIDFVRFENEKRDTTWYYALVNQQGWQYPKFVRLCTEKQLESYASATISPNQENYITKPTWSNELYNLLIQPLEPYLKKKKTIHWALVGLMNQLAMNTLQDNKGKMLGEKMEIHQYGSLKDFIIKKTGEGSTGSVDNSVLLVGDIAFDLNEVEHINLVENSKDENVYVMRSAPMDSTRGATRFVPLKGTKIEVENLSQAFVSKKWKIEQLQQKDALEEKVREYSGNKTPKVLHFATHGFFVSSKKQGYDNPLLRSGIALAGANRVWMGKPRIEGVEDGLWTAYEIANIDLSPAELVVLSACETAKGQIDPHEGVVGLQRSFKIAGVENMLLSLWQVPDKETVELMQEFYKYYLNGETPSVSLKKAQNVMRKKYPEPYYWAAFILIE